MLKKNIEAKVRPVGNPSLEKASLDGAARIYVSKDALISLAGTLKSGRLCVVERIIDDPKSDALPLTRQASLYALPGKDVSPNVVLMTRSFQEATGFKIGDQVRLSLHDAVPVAEVVVVQEVSEGNGEESKESRESCVYAPSWEFAISMALERAEEVFPGMVLEGVSIAKLRRSYKVLSVNSQTTTLATHKKSSTVISVSSSGEVDADLGGGELLVTGVPGLTKSITILNRFLKSFSGPFYLKDERTSCGFVIHGGHGTGKTFILQRLAEARWGRVHWIKPSEKLTGIRETFKQARSSKNSLVFIDQLDDLIPKDRSNRDAVITVIGEELDTLSAEAAASGALPEVVVIATCQDYMTDVPPALQKRSRFRRHIALPIPRTEERLEILNFFDPPIKPDEKQSCLLNLAQKTHAYNGDDLANLILTAKEILGDRLSEAGVNRESGDKHYLTVDDLEAALRVTRPTAMHDINLKPPTIHWQDVGGQESLKKTLSRMIRNTKDTNPQRRLVLPKPPKGLLLYGPPGCSKTLSAQAMATESGFNFFAVKGAELLNMYVGESERAVRTLFERARAASPSIIFFDEIDSIGGQRAGGGGSVGKSAGGVNMLTTLLTEMDGFEALTGVLVLAATNRPEAMDPALMRPGRFDQILYVGPPDRAAREAVFKVHLRGLTLASDVDVAALAVMAEGYSGAEIKAICTAAGQTVLDRCDEVESARMEIAMGDLAGALGDAPRQITKGMLDGYEKWSKQFKKI